MLKSHESKVFILGIFSLAVIYLAEATQNPFLETSRVLSGIWLVFFPLGYIFTTIILGQGSRPNPVERTMLSVALSIPLIVLPYFFLYFLAGFKFTESNAIALVSAELVVLYAVWLALARRPELRTRLRIAFKEGALSLVGKRV